MGLKKTKLMLYSTLVEVEVEVEVGVELGKTSTTRSNKLRPNVFLRKWNYCNVT